VPEQPAFVHLHNHSDYSLLDGASKIESMVETAASMGMSALALTDHGNLFGAIQFYSAAQKHGIKPIIGCEVYVAKEDRLKKTGGGDQSNHLVLLAENLKGYQNLSKLVSLGYLEGFYYKPRIDKSLLSQYSEGLIALSACLKGAIAQKLHLEQFCAAEEEANVLSDIFGKENFYLELQDHNLPAQKQVNPGIIEISKKTGIPLVCTNDTHYLLPQDSVAHDILLCIGTGKTVNQQDRMKYESDQFYFKSSQEMQEIFKHTPQALENTVRIAERCGLEIPTDQLLPPFKVPAEHTADSYFEEVTREGFQGRRKHLEIILKEGKIKYPLSAYDERLDFEIKMIQRMKFSSYFLIVWDLMKYARDYGIPVGPGRGSVVGSLVAYSLSITDIDPLQYELFFERFLNPERIAPPDIDMDFCMKRRSEMIEYVAQKYGRDNVCQIITFGTMAARGVIRDVGRSLDIPYAEVDRIAKLIPDKLNATIDDALEQEPRLVEEMKNSEIENLITIAKRLEGLSRHSSTHAAGVVIAPKPLVDLVPIQKTNKDEITSQYCMKDLESIGLLKLDFLALTTLTVIDNSVQRILEETGTALDLSSIPLTDEKVFALFSGGHTNGIFQFESPGMKNELRRLKPERFEDLIALNALYRPGPMDMIPEFAKRKQGAIEVKYPHPALEEILKETYGIIVYQEQVMQIASKLGGFSLGEADILRKAMGKKKIDIMNSMKEKFIEGARKNKISEKSSVQVFSLMEQFAQYGFNKSHSTAYALLAYQTAYLKVYYPVQFMSALLSSEIGNTDKIVMYIAECKEMGIPVLPPDINESDLHFSSVDGRIRFGMLAIRNVGEGVILSVLAYRKEHGIFRSLFRFCEEVDSRSLNKRVLESLVKSGAMDSLGWRRSQYMDMLDSAIESGQKARRDRESGQKGLFAVVTENGDSEIPEPSPPDIDEWPLEELLSFEKETLGFFVSGHPLTRFADEISCYSKKSISELTTKGQNTECQVAGIITDLRIRRTKKGDLMANFNLEDLSGSVPTIVFPNAFAKFESYLSADCPILVSGRFELEDERSHKVIVFEIEPLPGIIQRNAKSLCITACISSLSPTSAIDLHRLLEKNSGETGVDVQLYSSLDYSINIQSSDFVKVKSSPELIKQIEIICGQGSVTVIH